MRKLIYYYQRPILMMKNVLSFFSYVSFLWRSFLKIMLDLLALAEVNIQTYSSILSFSWLLCLISCMRYQQIFVAVPEKLPLFRRKMLKEEEEPRSSLLTWFGWELIIRQTAILRSKRTILIAMRRMMNNTLTLHFKREINWFHKN